MAVVGTPPREVVASTIRVQGVNNGDHGILIVPHGKQGATISVAGTAASATVNIGHRVGSAVQAYENSTTAVGEQNSVYAGEKDEVYAIIAASTATTDLTIKANAW